MKKFHYIYKITNTINGKYYIGRHSTDDLDDNYMGSGVAIKRAINKYGKDAFVKTIIYLADSFEDLVKFEENIITNEMILSELCYNMAPGGLGGTIDANWDEERRQNHKLAIAKISNDTKRNEKISNSVKSLHNDLGKDYWTEDGFDRMMSGLKKHWECPTEYTDEMREAVSKRMIGNSYGKWERTKESRRKTSETRKGKGCGERNAMSCIENREKVSTSKIGRKKMISSDKMISKYVLPENFQTYLDLGYSFADPMWTVG